MTDSVKTVIGKLCPALFMLALGACGTVNTPPARLTNASGTAQSARLAVKAEAATLHGNPWKALSLMRKAAALSPRDATLRHALGNAYLAVNLPGSAAASFGDAMTMGLRDDNVQRGWLLAQQGLGRSSVAAQRALYERKARAEQFAWNAPR